MKWNSVKYFLSAVLLLVASLSTSLATTSTATAVSSFDDTVKLTENLFFNSSTDGYSLPTECSQMPTVNLNQRYTEFILELADDGELDFGDNAEVNMNYSYSSTSAPSAYSSWQNKVNWAVSQYTRENPYGYSNQISITWTDTEGAGASFGYVGGDNRLMVTNATNVYQMNITFDNNSSCSVSANIAYYSSIGSSTSIYNPVLAWQGTTDPWKIYYAYWNITYPPDYEGINAPEVPPSSKEKLRPNIVIDVMNKDVSINSKIDDIVKTQYPDYKVFWFITNATFDGDGDSCEGVNPFTTSGYSLPSEPLTFEVPCYGAYSFNAYFSYNNGEYPIELDGYTVAETTINVDINGGIFSIDTDNDFVCNEVNFCQHESETWVDKPCDLFNLGGCVENILHHLKVLLGIEKTATNPTGSPFVSFTTESYGLLSIVSAPIVAINALTTSSCSPVSFTIPYVNKNITLPCYYSIYQTNLGGVFTLYQTIATGVIAYYVIVGILRQVKEIKDPKKDQIEVVHL